MADDSSAWQDGLHEALQANSPAHTERGSVLTGWVIVTEWMDPAGDRYLAKGHSSTLARWTADGFHHEALYGKWPTDDDQ